MNFFDLLLQVDSTNVISKTFTGSNVLDWFLSGLVGVIVTIIVFPYLENKFQSFVVRKLGYFKISGKYKISGKWTHKWHVKSESFNEINVINNVEIKQFRSKIFAQYDVTDLKGKIYTYQMLGTVEKDQVITGIWKDIQNGNRYHGCFQIFIDINEQTMIGYWTGLSREEKIKSGKWEWVREL